MSEAGDWFATVIWVSAIVSVTYIVWGLKGNRAADYYMYTKGNLSTPVIEITDLPEPVK